MKKIVGFTLLMLIVQSVYGQSVEQCLTVSGYSEELSGANMYSNLTTIKSNPAREMVMIGKNKIFRLAKDGSKLWEKTLIGDFIADYTIDKDGNVYVIHDISRRLTKFNANGTQAWEKATSGVECYRITVDQSNNVFVTGYNSILSRYFLTRYLPNGTESWTNTYTDWSFAVTVNSVGESYLIIRLSSGGIQIIKYNTSGNQIWSRNFSLNYSLTESPPFIGQDGFLYVTMDEFSSHTRLLRVNQSNGDIAGNVRIGNVRNPMVIQSADRIYILGLGLDGNSQQQHQVIRVNSDLTYSTIYSINREIYEFSGYRGFDIDTDGSLILSVILYNSFSDPISLFSKLDNQGLILDSREFKETRITTGIIAGESGNYFLPTLTDCLIKLVPCSNVAFSITSQPVNSAICSGSNTQFSVTASGTGLLYQWKKGTQLLSNNTKYSGVNTPILTITNANAGEDDGSYSCEIFDICNRRLTSNSATLSFIAPASITSQPANLTQCSGTQAVFWITTTGGQNVAFQWRKGGAIINDGGTITGSKTNTLTINNISATDAAEYWCDVTSTCFTTPITSQKGVLAVLPATSITAQPQAVSSCSGTTVIFSLSATGSGLTYQWRKDGVNLAESSTITGTTTSLLTLSNIASASAGQYTCVVSGSCGTPVTTSAATLTVTNAPQITQQPVSQSVCSGVNINFTVTATGSSLNYVWRKGSTVLTNSGKYSGVNTATLSVSAVTTEEEGVYTCTITNPCGTELISNAAQLSISNPPAITAKSADLTLCSDQLASMTVTATGSNLSYQWKKDGVALANNSRITGANTAQLLISQAALTDAGNYTCDVSGTCGATQISGIIKLMVQNAATITTQPVALTSCDGDQTKFSVTVSGGVQSYRWKRNGVNLDNSTRITGVTTATLIINATGQADQGIYTCEVATTCGTLLLSTGARLDVNPKPNLQLITPVSCDPFIPEWTALVQDLNNVFGTYLIFEKGKTTPLLGLDAVDKVGVYTIVKTSGVCSDTVEWNNTCLVTGLESVTTDVSIYPNPASEEVRISHQRASLIQVYDMKGMLVSAIEADPFEETTSLDVSRYAEGLYQVIGYSSSQQVFISKFIIRR